MCWGDDVDGSVSDAPAGTYVQISVGERTSCAINSIGQLQCWGRNACNQNYEPVGKYRNVDAFDCHVCAIEDDGEIECWGGDNGLPMGQLDAPSKATIMFKSELGSTMLVL